MDEQRKKIEKMALEILQKYDNESEIYVDVVKVASKMGFTVCEAEFNNDTRSFVLKDKKEINLFDISSDKIIGVDKNLSFTAKRMAIAEELGYFILSAEANKDNVNYAHRTYKNQDEQIDLFAVSLLMPVDRLVEQNIKLSYKSLSFEERIKILARRFGVTEIMMVYRFGELGIY